MLFPGPWASMIPWDVCRDADCSAPPQTFCSRIPGLGAWESAFNSVTQVIVRPVGLVDGDVLFKGEEITRAEKPPLWIFAFTEAQTLLRKAKAPGITGGPKQQ